MRLIDADELKKFLINEYEAREHYIGEIMLKAIDNAPTVEPCYQTTSCLDCGNYDKENHNCPRYCEVIKEAIKTQGTWIKEKDGTYFDFKCSLCNSYALERGDYPELSIYCPACGARMEVEHD